MPKKKHGDDYWDPAGPFVWKTPDGKVMTQADFDKLKKKKPDPQRSEVMRKKK